MEYNARRSLTWGKRLFMVVLIMGIALYGVALLAERSKEPMRKGFEDYIAGATGHRATITELAVFELVPDTKFVLKGIDLRDSTDPKKILARAESLSLSLPAWRLFTGFIKYHAFELKNLELASGYVFPDKLQVTYAGITDGDIDTVPNLVVEGRYRDQDLLITGDMKREAAGKRWLYSFERSFPITFKLGMIEASGLYVRGLTTISLKQMQVVRGNDRAEFVFKDIDPEVPAGLMEGTINDVPVKGELNKSGETVTLSIRSEAQDAGSARKIVSFISLLEKDLGLEGQEDTGFRIVLENSDAGSGVTTQKEKETE